jgi:hypothetical protein
VCCKQSAATRRSVGNAESASYETKDYMAFHTVYLFTKYTLFYFVLDCVKQILTFNQYLCDALFTHSQYK